jgi:prepilin signal peptidase PulO-like enzyme (type II secretory pathway)
MFIAYFSPLFIWSTVFIFGLIIGSFLNCLIWRLHKKETLGGRSYCPHCRQTIAWHDNLPVLSFIFLRGRCRTCRAKISWQYPLVELATAILFLLTWQMNSVQLDFYLLLARDWLLIVTLIVVFVYDWRWQLIPLTVVWPLGIAIFILNLLLGFFWLDVLFFAVAAAGFFWLQYLITRRKGLGEGDIWLGAFLGLSFPGTIDLLSIMVLSYSLGAIVGLTLISRQRKKWQSQIALGPFLALGAVITLIWGERLFAWYLGFF